VVQPEILVQRRPVPAVAERLRSLLRSAAFTDYMRMTGCAGLEQALLVAYLAYAVQVTRPAAGLAVTRQLLEVFRA
jgi:hypothetical protein